MKMRSTSVRCIIGTFIAIFLFLFTYTLLINQNFHQDVLQQAGTTLNSTISSILDSSKISFMLPNLDLLSDRSSVFKASEYPIIASTPMPEAGTEQYDMMEGIDIINVKNDRCYFMIHNLLEHMEIAANIHNILIEKEMTASLYEDPKPSDSNYFKERNLNAPKYPVINFKFNCFRNVDGIYQTMDYLSAEYPTLVDIVDLGPSYLKSIGKKRGYEIKAMVLTNKDSNVFKSPLFVICGIHPRELAPVEGCARFAEDILAEYGKDSDKTWILDYTEIHMVLLANPDGRRSEETFLYRFKRKNEHGELGSCGYKTRFAGVDLNRNFPHAEWGTSGTPQRELFEECREQYPGKFPGSEKETQAIVQHIESVLPPGTNVRDLFTNAFTSDSMGALIDVHSSGEDFFWPYAYEPLFSPNEIGFASMARKMAFHTIPTYTCHNVVYPTSGDSTDYAYDAVGVAAFTMEVGRKFHESCDYFEEYVEKSVKGALLYAARVSRAPFKFPKGPEVRSISISNSTPSKNDLLEVSISISDYISMGWNVSGFFDLSSYETGEQIISSLWIFIDSHPYEPDATPIQMIESNRTSVTETMRFTISLSELSVGKHTLFFQAYDTDGPGPVFSKFVEIME